MIESLFVYGTLAPERPNAHILHPFSGTWEPASIRGNLIDDGWGAEMGYPAIIPDENGEIVEGFVFSSTEIDWQMLDEFEGAGYSRQTAKATLSTGEQVTAFVYSLNDK